MVGPEDSNDFFGFICTLLKRDVLPPQVECVVGPEDSIGLVIRGGAEYGLGIYVTGVDEGSAAYKSDIQVRYTLFTIRADALMI